MLTHRGFSAWITSDNMELVEFEPRTDEKANKVICWIAGPIGKPFVVHWRDHGSNVDSASYIYFDGFKVSGQFLYGHGEELRRGVRVGPQEERPFVFSRIEQDDAIGYDAQASNKNVGSITLEIKQIKRVEVYGPNKVREPPKVIRGHRQEGDVCVRYGETRPTATQKPTWKIRPHDPDAPGPFVTFMFRYRSKDWLMEQGIINDDDDVSRTPPSPWPIETPLETPTASRAESMEPEEPEEEPDESPSPSPSTHVSPLSPRDALGVLSPRDALGLLGVGARPESSRNPSNDSSIRSFSGTWDPSSANGEYHEISWDEYQPPTVALDALDRQELDDYYK
ncbi:hypothetical protein BD413DRAFT_660032 [Trametes elegans]|nr:hypothetical protein BD413DRAFT_660032 [Trametes elegans]